MSDLSHLHGKAVEGHPNLQYWGNNGSIRVRVQVVDPVARKALGRVAFYKGLGTKDVPAAAKKSHRWIAEFEDKIAAAREPKVFVKVRHQPRSFSIENLQPAELQRIAAFVKANFPDAKLGSVRGVFGEAGDFRLSKPTGVWAWVPQKEADKLPADLPLAGITYQAVIELWKAEAKPAKSSVRNVTRHCNYFFSRLGHNDLSRATRADIIAHKESLINDGKNDKPLENKTINNHMASIRIIVKFAFDNEKIKHDPGGVKKLKVTKTSPRAKGYTPEQYNRIIAEARKSDDPAIKFLWLLGCLHGGRISEFADATVDAIYQKAGRWVFDISEQHRREWNGKPLPLKNEGSARVIPIHSCVVKNSGFIKYVETLRREKGDKAPLFPMFAADQDGLYAKAASERCLKWLRKHVGINGRWLDYHRTRHNLITLMRTAGVSEEMHDAITGHSGGGVSRTYGETEIRAMAKAIEKIKVAGA